MAESNDTKVCRSCGSAKPLSEFGKKERCIFGVRPDCKACFAEARRARYATDDEHRRSVLDGQKRLCAQPAPGYLKRCPKCGEEKPFEAYYRSSYSKDNCSSYCKVCRNQMSTSYARENKDRIKPNLFGYGLKRKYGITASDYEEMLVRQGFKCAICGAAECQTGRNFAVDHCHSTGKVRGLLCGHCNQGLGVFRDDIPRMLKAIEYLKAHAPDYSKTESAL